MNRTLAISAMILTALVLGGCGGERSGQGVEREASPAQTDPSTTSDLARADFVVEGMDCGGCVIGTRMALRKLDGVVEADASYDERTGGGAAWARYDPSRVAPEQMMSAIRKLGYRPTLMDADPGS